MDPAEFDRSEWDIAVIGAGPAGSVAAYALAREGFSVLLIDKEKFPRKKVCGACLNERALAGLAALGLKQAVLDCHPHPLSKFHLAHRGRAAEIPIRLGVSLSRERLDETLARKAREAGAVFLDGVQGFVRGVSGNRREVELEERDSSQGDCPLFIRARVVIAADGLGGSSLKHLKEFTSIAKPRSHFGAGISIADGPEFFRPGEIYMAVGDDGYAGAVRLEDGRLNIAAALGALALKQAEAATPAHAVARILGRAGFPEIPDLANSDFRGTPLLTRRRNRIAAERLLVIGDSAGYVEPFTGEGMEWAIASGRAAAGLAREGARAWHPGLARRWTHTYQSLIGCRQFSCRLVSLALRNPLLISLAIKGAGPLSLCKR